MITAENTTVRPEVITDASYRGLDVVALGDFLPEPADDEQAVVDGDTETHHRDDGLGEEVHRPEFGGEAQDAERAARWSGRR